MADLTKAYRVIYDDNQIVNDDFLEIQSGHTYPALDKQYFETDNKDELLKFVTDNNLFFLPNNILIPF